MGNQNAVSVQLSEELEEKLISHNESTYIELLGWIDQQETIDKERANASKYNIEWITWLGRLAREKCESAEMVNILMAVNDDLGQL